MFLPAGEELDMGRSPEGGEALSGVIGSFLLCCCTLRLVAARSYAARDAP